MSDDQEDHTRIIPPDDITMYEPPPSPLDPGNAESGAASGRPPSSEDPVVAEPAQPRRKPTPGAPENPPQTPPSFDPPAPQPLRPGGAAIAGAAGAAAGAAGGAAGSAPTPPPLPGTPQAGTPQAGTPQSGTPQAGTPQAGTPQTGQPGQPGQPGTPQTGQPGVPSVPQPGTPSGTPAPGAVPPAGGPSTPGAVPDASQTPASNPSGSQQGSSPQAAAHSQEAPEEASTTASPSASSEKKEAPNKGDIPASQRQPAYNRSPYEKASGGGDDKTKQLIWALVGSAFVLSIVSLLLSLGVLSIDSSQVRSADIADGAVGSRQIAPGSVRESNLAADLQRDIFGKEGPPGPQGETGPRGSRGPAGISEIRTVEREVGGTSVDAEVSGVALCDDGEIVLSGGAMISGSEGTVALTVSEPTSELSGWRGAAVQNEPTQGSWSLRVYALCATPTNQLRNNSLP